MLAKKWMALTKLCLILACSSSLAQSWDYPRPRQVPGDSVFGFTYHMSRLLESRMSKIDLQYHSLAAYHALNNAENGELVEWFNDKDNSLGKIRVVYTWPSSDGWCRRLHSWVNSQRTVFTYEDTACYNTTRNTWNFIDKY